MVFIYTWQHQRVAVTLEPQNPYALLQLLQSQGLTALLRLQ